MGAICYSKFVGSATTFDSIAKTPSAANKKNRVKNFIGSMSSDDQWVKNQTFACASALSFSNSCTCSPKAAVTSFGLPESSSSSQPE